MRTRELQLLEQIQTQSLEAKAATINNKINEDLCTLLETDTQPRFTSTFLNQPIFISYLESLRKAAAEDKEHFIEPHPLHALDLLLHIECYLANNQEEKSATEHLDKVEEALKICFKSYIKHKLNDKDIILIRDLGRDHFVKRIYATNDAKLLQLYQRYYPTPRAQLFSGEPLPPYIAEREAKMTASIHNILQQHPLKEVETKIIPLQRKLRATLRLKEQQLRYPKLYTRKNFSVEQTIHDANTPYKPQCEEKLSQRIMNASKQVKVFNLVRHKTSASNLACIFNDGFFGRKNLVNSYLPFRSGSLHFCDIEDADNNSICLSSQQIDPKSDNGIQLSFVAEKLCTKVPHAFFKQRDLGFSLVVSDSKNSVRTVMIGDLKINFVHDGDVRLQNSGIEASMSLWLHIDREITTSDGAIQYHKDTLATYKYKERIIDDAILYPKHLLVSSNIKDMHRILTLNFFRFLDNMRLDRRCTTIVYEALGKLSDKELVNTLYDIGSKLSDTMEFNFYGAYRFDFDSLHQIQNQYTDYVLSPSAMIHSAQEGKLELLIEAKQKIPQVFLSYRFIDYLIENIQHAEALDWLKQERKNCILPSWLHEWENRPSPSFKSK